MNKQDSIKELADQYNEIVALLEALVSQVEEDIPKTEGTIYLWEAVDNAKWQLLELIKTQIAVNVERPKK